MSRGAQEWTLPAGCNATDPWRPLGMMLDLWILPIVCISGLTLNMACLVVFTHRKLSDCYYSSGSCYKSPSNTSSKDSTNSSGCRGKCSVTSASMSGGNYMGRKSGVGTPTLNPVTRSPSTMSSYERDSLLAYRSSLRSRTGRRRRHPLVPALILLSICDSLQLLFSLFVLYLPALHDHLEMDPFGWVAQIAYLATGALAGGLLASNCASIWTCCYISLQRHRAIVNPLSSVTASKSASHLPLCGIALAAVLFNAPVWFEFSWSVSRVHVGGADAMNEGTTDSILHESSSVIIIWHARSSLAQSETYRFIMHKVLYPIAVYLIPLILIFVLNMRILSYIAASTRLQCTSVGQKHRLAKERRSVMLLISIVLMFFLCHTGGLVIRFFDFGQYGNAPCFVFAKDFVNFMFNVNSFANPMLYFFFTKQFKDLRTNWNAKSKASLISNGHTTTIHRNNSTPSGKRMLERVSTHTMV